MRIRLLIATGDADYAQHLSGVLSEHYADVIDVCVCREKERLPELTAVSGFDAALADPAWIAGADWNAVLLPVQLWEEQESAAINPEICIIRKYQRISSIVADILEHYSKVSADRHDADSGLARITAVWSPAGGVGKTTVAHAYAAKKASDGKQVLYLNVENFSGASVFFPETGKSISAIFEMLENHEGNVKALIRGIQKRDAGSGVAYFGDPENFDDINILSDDNISSLISACAGVADELVVDMPCQCDERARRIFELSDKIYIVTDPSNTALAKLSQFTLQHNVFTRIRSKAVLVANKNAAAGGAPIDSYIRLPLIQSTDASSVSKALSGHSFEEQGILS